MSLTQFIRSARGQFALSLIHAFNVAAICALGVWHGYLFRVEHAAPPARELKLVAVKSYAACMAPQSHHVSATRTPR